MYRKLRLMSAVLQVVLLKIKKLKALHKQLQTDIQFLNKQSVVYANKHKS
jgi:hypothetical protein